MPARSWKTRRRIPWIRALFALLAGVLVAGAANADKLLFQGTHAIRFSHNAIVKEVSATGTGVAVVNNSAGGSQLHTLRLTRPFAEIDETVGTTGPGVQELRFEGVRINQDIGGALGDPGVFAPIFAVAQGTELALTQNTLPGAGTIRICNLFGCGSSIDVDLSQTTAGVAIGPGVGSTFTVFTPTSSRSIVVQGQPWKLGTTMVTYETALGGTGTITSTGFVGGPPTSMGAPGPLGSTLPSGTLQLVTGIQTSSVGLDGPNSRSGLIARLRLQFMPEPGWLLLLGSGSVAMALVGRRRMHREQDR